MARTAFWVVSAAASASMAAQLIAAMIGLSSGIIWAVLLSFEGSFLSPSCFVSLVSLLSLLRRKMEQGSPSSCFVFFLVYLLSLSLWSIDLFI